MSGTGIMVDDQQVQAVDQLLDQLLWGMHLKKCDAWTPELERIGALGLHVLKLAGETENIILREIRETLDIPHSTLTSVVNRLENRGLIERVISPRDRRSYGLALTGEGQRIQAAHERLDRALARAILEGLDSAEERRTFVSLIEKISRHLAGEDR
jgi:DNA-binding MarR family transcriptional regulator